MSIVKQEADYQHSDTAGIDLNEKGRFLYKIIKGAWGIKMKLNERYTAVDVETTGLNPESDMIIEIGAVRYVDGEAFERFEEFINPGTKIPQKIIELTGITDDMVADARKENDVIRDFIKFLGDDIILGHNIMFDFSFLKTAASRQGLKFEKKGIDTLSLCAFFHKGIPSRSLYSMRTLYGICSKNSHRAFSDASASAQLYELLKEKHYKQYPEIFKESNLFYKVKKHEVITEKQKKYLSALLAGHKINYAEDISLLSKSDASRMIDKILSEHGRLF